MAYQYAIDPDAGIVEVTVTGVETTADSAERMRLIISNKDWRPGLGVVVDLRGVERIEGDFRQALGLIDAHKAVQEQIGASRIALVAGSKGVFGVGRMWQTLSDNLPYAVQVFEDLDEARAWVRTGAR